MVADKPDGPAGDEAIAVEIQTGTAAGRHPADALLTRWIVTAAGPQAGRELTLRVVGEPESTALNRRYRGREYATNVLSFRADDWPEIDGERQPLGDLVVCAPVIEREAAEAGRDAEAHWAHIVIHGVLHLLGHDHETDRDAATMEREETRLLTMLGYPDPHAAAP